MRQTPTEPNNAKPLERVASWLRWLAALPGSLVSLVLELLLSRRALAVASFAAFALLAVSPWLRPPLQRDLRGPHIPYAVFGGALSPDRLGESRDWRLDSVAAPLLAVSAVGLIGVLIDPKRLPLFSGAVAALAIAGGAAATLNHPQLIAAFDHEFEQRGHLRQVLGDHHELAITGLSGSRINMRAPREGLVNVSVDPDHAEHGWHYLVWAPWLALGALGVTVVATPGGLWRRLGVVGVWLVIGVGLATAATHRRLIAEYRWRQAEQLELANRFDESRAWLERLADGMPDFRDSTRMLLTRGRIDLREGLRTPEAAAFVAIHKKDDEGGRYELDRVADQLPDSQAARDLAATAYYDEGALAFAEFRAAAAQQAWQRACELSPWRLDCRVSHAVVTEQLEDHKPELIEALLLPVAAQLGDRLLRADVETLIGDSYFESGRLVEARRYYADSMDTFSLPRFINPFAQEAMLGM